MRTHDGKFVRAVMCAIMIAIASPLQVLAQTAMPAPAVDPVDANAALQTARDLIKTADYEHAIGTLTGLIGQQRQHADIKREAYLLLIKTYVYVGNDFKPREQGREIARLNYNKARELIAECLRIPELRHTRPEPETDYPEEMVGFFKDVRAQIFGSFRVTAVSPAGAVVLFDADTLRSAAGQNSPGDVDLAIGQHLVVVRSAGYRDVTEEITIGPGATLEQGYLLTRKRGTQWYASRAGAAFVVVSGLFAILAKPSASDAPPVTPPIAGPPPPPARAH